MGGAGGRQIESAVGGRHTRLSPIGVTFPVTTANLLRWHAWWRYVVIDQVFVWALFCGIGIFLTVNLATSVVPPGQRHAGFGDGPAISLFSCFDSSYSSGSVHLPLACF